MSMEGSGGTLPTSNLSQRPFMRLQRLHPRREPSQGVQDCLEDGIGR